MSFFSPDQVQYLPKIILCAYVICNELTNEQVEFKYHIHMVELMMPHEDNISLAHERKDNRYEALVGEC